MLSSQSMYQYTIGGSNPELGEQSIIQTPDGGFVIVGTTTSFGAGANDVYVVKLDNNRSIQWTKSIGGSSLDYAVEVIRSNDGGYVIAGYTNSFGAGSYDMYMIKLDVNGTFLWNKTFGGSLFEEAISVIQTTDGGYALSGTTQSFGAGSYDFLIVKTDGNGSMQWSKTIGGTGVDVAWELVQNSDGSYVLGGGGSSDFCAVKLDAAGSLVWSKTIGGSGFDFGYSIIKCNDGGFALTGVTGSFTGGNNLFVIKLDTDGLLQWSKSIGGVFNDAGVRLIQNTNGDFLITGYSNSFVPDSNNIFLVKLNGAGTLQFSKTIGGSGADISFDIIQTAEGGYAITGLTRSFGLVTNDIYLVKLDASGNACGNSYPVACTVIDGGEVHTNNFTLSTPAIISNTPSSVLNTGGSITLTCLVGNDENSTEFISGFELSQNYPNPFNPSTKITFALPKSGYVKLTVYDNLGRHIESLVNEYLTQGSYEFNFDASSFPSGVYFYKLEADGFMETKKMLLVK